MTQRSLRAPKLTRTARTPAPSANAGSTGRRPNWLRVFGLVLIALATYIPVLDAGFIWDDDDHVERNVTLRSLAGLKSIWFDVGATPQYYPLVHTTFWLEYHIWGLKAVGYHVVNVLLHAANAVLLWLLLRRLAVPGAWLAAALFAVHPVEVESVAWITERKNVLSTLCYMGSFLVLLRFWPPEVSEPQPTGRWRYYGWALVLFGGALLSKTVACSLPAAFLLVRWWKQGRLTLRDLLVAAPLFILGLGLAVLTIHLERTRVGAQGEEWDLSAVQRVLIAGRAVWFYASKLVWPVQLTFTYPRWQIDAGMWWQYLFPVTGVALVAALWLLRGRLGRGPLAAVLFFGGSLVPALGFFNIYPMRYSFVADHFQYLASIGLLVLFAAGLTSVVPRFAGGNQLAMWGGCGILLAVLALLAIQQTAIYEDPITLWSDTLTKNPDCWLALNNRGSAYKASGDAQHALVDFNRAIEVAPNNPEVHRARGELYLREGRFGLALRDFDKALVLKSPYAEALNSRGAAWEKLGKFEQAAADFQQALLIEPKYALPYNGLGTVHRDRHEWDQAIRMYDEAIRLDPACAEAYSNRGLTYGEMGLRREALADHDVAIQLDPRSTDCFYNRGVTYHQLGRREHDREQIRRAIADYDEALARNLGYLVALTNRAGAFADLNQYEAAVRDYTQALRLQPDNAAIYFNRAMVRLRLNNFAQARKDVDEGKRCGGTPSPDLVRDLQNVPGGSQGVH